MEAPNSLRTQFEIPVQTPQASNQVTPAQSLRWADYDDDDTDWMPEDIKARISAQTNATTNSNISQGSVQQSQPAPNSSDKKGHPEDNETEAPVLSEPRVSSFSGSVLSLKQIQPGLESNDDSSELADILFSNFSGIQRLDDDEVEIRSHFSDSSDEDEDEPHTKPTSLSAQNLPWPQLQTPFAASIHFITRQQNSPIKFNPMKPQVSSPSPAFQSQALHNKPSNEKEGPHIPPSSADVAYEQLARLHHLCEKEEYAMNAAQMMLYKRLKPVQDKEERGRYFSRADSWRLKALTEPVLADGNKGEKFEVWGFSRFDPRWESLEGRLERERRVHHDTKFVLEKVWGQLEDTREKMVGLKMKVGEMQRMLKSKDEEMGKVKFELRVKVDEIELMKQKFAEKFQELVDKCKAKIVEVEELQESKHIVGETEVRRLQEELDRIKEWNAILMVDKQQLSSQVGELQDDQKTWLEIIGVHRTQRKKRRRSDGEIYTRTQEIDALQWRLTNCTEKLSEVRIWSSKFKESYAALQQDLYTEKEERAELLKETYTIRAELKETRDDANEKETMLKALTAEMETLVIVKDQLAANLESFKRQFATIQEAAPLETLINLQSQLQDERAAKEKIQTENDRLKKVVSKLGHLPPQHIIELQEKHKQQLNDISTKAEELQKQNEKLKHDYETKYTNLHIQMNQAQEAAWHAQEANGPLLKHVEELSSEVKDLQEKLQKAKEDLSDKVDQCDTSNYYPKKMLEYVRQEKWQHYQQRSELIANINELNSRVKEFEAREERYGKTIRRQKERIRGLEDDLIYANASLGQDNEPLKVAKIPRKRRELCKVGQIEIQRYKDIDAMGWVEREERWKQVFGLRTRYDDGGKLHLDRDSEAPSLDSVKRKMTQIEM